MTVTSSEERSEKKSLLPLGVMRKTITCDPAESMHVMRQDGPGVCRRCCEPHPEERDAERGEDDAPDPKGSLPLDADAGDQFKVITGPLDAAVHHAVHLR